MRPEDWGTPVVIALLALVVRLFKWNRRRQVARRTAHVIQESQRRIVASYAARGESR